MLFMDDNPLKAFAPIDVIELDSRKLGDYFGKFEYVIRVKLTGRRAAIAT